MKTGRAAATPGDACLEHGDVADEAVCRMKLAGPVGDGVLREGRRGREGGLILEDNGGGGKLCYTEPIASAKPFVRSCSPRRSPAPSMLVFPIGHPQPWNRTRPPVLQRPHLLLLYSHWVTPCYMPIMPPSLPPLLYIVAALAPLEALWCRPAESARSKSSRPREGT